MRVETFALERWMSHWETVVHYDLAESGIRPLSMRELIAFNGDGDTLDSLLDLRLGYSEARGTADLRSILAATYENTSPDNILVTTGAIEANYLLFNTLLDAGDHVVAVYPAYQQLYSVPRAIGCEVSLWTLRADNGFRFDLDELEQIVTDHTRLIVINSPHNPTGSVLSPDELARVYQIAERVGAWVIGDEAYRWLSLPGGEPLAEPVRNLGERGISVGTLSKPFGLPGLRLGWMAAPAEVVSACWAQRDYISLSPGKLSDALAILALRNRDQIFARTKAISGRNLGALEAWIKEREGLVDWVRPRGGLLGLLHYNLSIPSMDLADRLAAEASVMLAPGSAFGYEDHLRVGLGQEPGLFAEGLEVTAAFLERLASEE